MVETTSRSRLRRYARAIGRIALCLLAALLAVVGVGVAVAWRPMGHAPDVEAASRFPLSDHLRDGRFINRQAAWVDERGAAERGLGGAGGPAASPAAPVPATRPTTSTYAHQPASGLRLTWLGHSTALVEIDGVRILIDPLLSDRASPLPWIGPTTWYPLPLASLPPIDVVLISHDHYDHLDRAAVMVLAQAGGRTRFLVPLGLGSHLRYWGIPADRITELDWWQSAAVGQVRVFATPARHTSGRVRPGSDQTLWAGFAMNGPTHRVWYSGDTGFHEGLRAIGQRLGPFDVTLIDSGQYSRLWPDHHLGPEMAVVAHRMVRGAAIMPIHWGRLQLADHGWTEPVERVLLAARCAGVRVLTPRPGEPIEPQRQAGAERWWPPVRWQRMVDAPIRPTLGGSPAKRYSVVGCPTRKRSGAIRHQPDPVLHLPR